MPIRYILKQLLMPPGVLLLLIVLAWWLRQEDPLPIEQVAEIHDRLIVTPSMSLPEQHSANVLAKRKKSRQRQSPG